MVTCGENELDWMGMKKAKDRELALNVMEMSPEDEKKRNDVVQQTDFL